jgi:hypothetical protein
MASISSNAPFHPALLIGAGHILPRREDGIQNWGQTEEEDSFLSKPLFSKKYLFSVGG